MSEPTPPKPFPWRTAFLVSLGLNLLAVGGIAGAFGSGARLERPALQSQGPTPQPDDVALERVPGPRAFLNAVPPAQRQAMLHDLAGVWRNTRNERGAAHDARVELYDAAVADPYDAARVKRAFAQVRAANQTALAPYQNSLADSFGAMSAAERRAALESVLTRPLNEPAPAQRSELRERLQQMPREERRELLRERWRERREQRLNQ